MSGEERRRALPPGAAVERWTAPDGTRLRLMTVRPDGPARGTILFAQGRGDFIEKQVEALADWREAGFAIATFDWRGQGASEAHRGPDVFGAMLADLSALVPTVAARMPAPLHVVGHSMGGHMVLRWLSGGGQAGGRVVLVAPMVRVLAVRAFGPLGRFMTRAAIRLGRGQERALGQRPPGPWRRSPERQRLLTHDDARFAAEQWWLHREPSYALGGVTWDWIDGAERGAHALAAPGAVERVDVPTLFLVPTSDLLVDVRATFALAGRMQMAEVERFAGARHELLCEADRFRTPAIERMLRFLG